MPKYLTLAFTTPVDGRDDEYNDWYDNVAMPLYRTLPDTRPLGRFKAVQHKGYEFEIDNQFDYVTLYEIDTEDLDGYFAEVRERLEKATAEGRYHFSETIDKTKFFEPMFEPWRPEGDVL